MYINLQKLNILQMTNVIDYLEEISKLLRDVLRGVDSDGNSNGYVTSVHHPKDYESDRTTLKASSEWIDRRSYIIVGVLKKDTDGPIISIEPVDVGEIKIDGQGSTCYDLVGGIWQIKIDASAAKPNQRSWRDRISQQVLKSLADNEDTLFDQLDLVKLNFAKNNITDNDQFIDIIQVNIDMSLTK